MIKRCLLLCFLFLNTFLFAQNWPADTVKGRVNTGNPKYPFPQFHGYAHGTSLSNKNAEGVTDADMEKTMREAYLIMMHRAIYENRTFKGKRYITFNNPTVPHNYNTFVSEGDGYALIAAAYFADKETFDGLWLWVHDNRLSGVKKYYDCTDLRAGYPYGRLPGWKNDETTAITNENPNGSAADGDFDIAMGLLIAQKQWGDNMGITDACGNQISYKDEALKMIKSLVDTVYYNRSISGAQPGTLGYLTGNIGVDGYVKSGNTWGEMTNWRVSAGNTIYPWAKSIPDPITTPSKYVDYMAPAYFNQFAKFLQQNGGTKWQIGQFKRSEAASDWIMGEMYKKGYIASAGTYTVNLDGSATTFGPFSDGEDFRLPWRTVLNYVWHGNPDSTWNPLTHQLQPGVNTFERDMGVRHGNFMKFAGSTSPTNASESTAYCGKLGASPDLSCPNWRGVSQIKQNYFQNGTASANYGSNFALGASAPAAVATGDHDLVAEMYRQSELVWDDASTKSGGLTDDERYILSTPKYFHGWFRVLGLLTNSGCLAPPDDMKPVGNMRVYMSVDKTFAYEGDLLTYTVSYRNYGSSAASGVSIATTLDNNYQFVSATNGGTLSGNGISWTVGNVPGFTTGGLAATQGSMKFTVRVKSISAAVISCLKSTITSANLPAFTSNEYPNNASYTMERNCVDLLKDRVLSVKKSSDRTIVNGGDIVNFKIEFENKTGSNLWLNGGRDRVLLSYANFAPSPAYNFYQFYRIWHTGHEAYINLGNYRVSYFINDPVAIGAYNVTTNPNGWSTFVDNQNDLDKYGYNPSTLPLNQQLKFTYQKIPWGTDAKGSWNQRVVTQFANVLSAPSTHIYDKLDSEYLLHKGVKGPGFTRTRFLANPAADLAPRIADDWSYSSAANNGALDGQAQRFFPVSPTYTNFANNFAPIEATNYSKDVCDPNVANFEKVLVEEFDGFTWRRIAGNGPLPGRETYNVLIVDSIPVELTFGAFTNATTLGVTATYTALTGNSRYSGIVRWTVPVMLTGEKGLISYTASTKAVSCPVADKNFVNAAWISSSVDSPDSSSIAMKVSCTPAPPTSPAETSLKKTANKTNVQVGDVITYSLTFTNKDGSTGTWNGSGTLATEWRNAGTAVVPNPKTAGNTISFDQNANNNSGPYGLEHVKVHGKNGWVESTIDPTNASTLSYFFRHTTGTPGNANFLGIRLEITPNIQGPNTANMVVYNNNTVHTTMNNLSYGGTSDPIKIRMELIEDKLNIWTGDFTGAPLKVIIGLTNQDAGYTGMYANGSQQSITTWKGHFDSAFDLIMTDAVPAELNNITNISNGGSNTARTVTWPAVAGPILASAPPIVRTFDATVDTCSNFITNIGKASVYGVTNIQSQNVVKCGGSTCSFTTAGLTPVGSVNICTGQNVTISLTASTNGTSNIRYQLYKDVSTVGTAQPNAGFTVSSSGNYKVRAFDNADPNCFAESPVVVVNISPLPNAPVLTSPLTFCKNETPSIITVSPSANNELVWYTADAPALTGQTVTTPVVNTSVTSTSTYYVSQRNTTAPNCESAARTKFDVIVTDAPVATITTTGSALQYCSGTNGVTLTATPVNGATYEWFKAGQSQGTASASNTFANATIGNYTVKVTIPGNCPAASTPEVIVSNSTSLVPALDISAQLKVCENTTLDVNIASQSNGTIEWFEDGVNKGISPSYSPIITKSVRIKAILTSSEICANPKTASDSVDIAVDKLPSKANITSAPKPVKEICTSSIALDATSPIQGIGSWFLNVGSPGVISPAGVLSSIPNATFIKVYYKVTNGICSQNIDSIYIKKADSPSIVDIHSQSKSICNDVSYVAPLLTSPATRAGETATWEPAPGTLASISGSGQTSNLKPGQNKFYYKITNNSCSSVFSLDSVTITLDTLPKKPNAGTDKETCSSDFKLEAIASSQQIKWSASNPAILFDVDSDYNTFVRNLPLNTLSQLILSATNGACNIPLNDTVNISSIGTLTQARVKQLSKSICNGDNPPLLTGNTVQTGEIAVWKSLTSGVSITSSGIISNISFGKNMFEYSISGNVCPGITKDTVTINVLITPEAYISLPKSSGTYQTTENQVSLQAATDAPDGYNAKWEISGQGTLSNNTGAFNSLGNLTNPGITKVMWIMAENSNTCPPDTAFIYVERLSPDFINAGKDTTVCEISLPVLKGMGSKTGTWKALTPQTTFIQNGTEATISSASSTQINKYSYCIGSTLCDTVEVKVNQVSDLSVSIFSPSVNNCPGDSVILKPDQISPQGTSSFTYQWLRNGIAIQNATSETLKTSAWQNSDGISLRIKAKNASASCLRIDSATSEPITLNEIISVVPAVSVNADTTLLNCESDAVKFMIQNKEGLGANPLYFWLINDKVISNDSVLNSTSWKTGDEVFLKVKSSQSCAVTDTAFSNKITLKGTARKDNKIGLIVSGIPSGNIICEGTELVLKAESSLPDLIYEWFDGLNTFNSPSITQTILTNANYSLKVKSKPGCYLSGDSLSETTSFSIRVLEPIILKLIYDSLGNCKGTKQSFRVTTGSGIISSFNWYVNDTIQIDKKTNVAEFPDLKHHDIVKAEAIPSLTCNSSLNKTVDTARVNVYDKPRSGFVNINSDELSLCPSDKNVQLTANESNPGYTYTWSKNNQPSVSQGNTLAYQGDGTYKLIIQNNSCSTTTAVNIKTAVPVVKINTDKVDFVAGENITAAAGIFGFNQQPAFFWTPSAIAIPNNENQTTLFPTETFMLKVVAIATDGCSSSDSILIRKRNKLFIPNAINPGTADINAFWGIKGTEDYPGIDIKVFNRWGNLVYEQKGYNTPWDGTLNGKDLPTGTYYYVIKDDKLKEPLVGDLTIIR